MEFSGICTSAKAGKVSSMAKRDSAKTLVVFGGGFGQGGQTYELLPPLIYSNGSRLMRPMCKLSGIQQGIIEAVALDCL